MKFRRRALLISCVLTLAPIVLPRAVVHAAGSSWPPSQALPHFPQATHLDVVDTMAPTTCPGGCSGDDRLLLATLEGVIGRTQPRIYILEQLNDIQSDQNNQWLAYLNTLGVSTTMGVTEDQILRRYDQSTGDGEIKGFIVYDPALRDTINIATTLAGLDDGVVASPDVGARLAAAPYNMRQLDDLRGRFPDAMTAYNWAHNN